MKIFSIENTAPIKIVNLSLGTIVDYELQKIHEFLRHSYIFTSWEGIIPKVYIYLEPWYCFSSWDFALIFWSWQEWGKNLIVRLQYINPWIIHNTQGKSWIQYYCCFSRACQNVLQIFWGNSVGQHNADLSLQICCRSTRVLTINVGEHWPMEANL